MVSTNHGNRCHGNDGCFVVDSTPCVVPLRVPVHDAARNSQTTPADSCVHGLHHIQALSTTMDLKGANNIINNYGFNSTVFLTFALPEFFPFKYQVTFVVTEHGS